MTTDADPLALATREEVERYASAVLAGETGAARPGSLAATRMRIRYTGAKAAAGYRTSAASEPALTIHVSRASRAALLMWPFAACAVVGVASTWLHRQGAPNGWLFAATILVGLYALVRTSLLFDRYELQVKGGLLRYESSRFWPKAVVALPIASVELLFVTEQSGRFHLEARLRDGKTALLVAHVAHADLAVYFERQLELAMRALDRPIEGEVPREVPLPERPQSLRALLEIGVIGGVVLAVVVGFRAVGVPLVTLRLGDADTSATFSAPRAGEVQLTTDVDLERSEWSRYADIPRSIVYRIAIERDGVVVAALECDPLESTLWTSEEFSHRIRSFEASLDHCAAELPAPGRYTLRARRAYRRGVPRIDAETTLTLRQ